MASPSTTGIPAPGMLLVATAALTDPNFAGTVILIVDHNSDGALGVVLNQPSTMPITAVLEPWSPLASEPAQIFMGGPVAPDGALAVARLRDASEQPPGFTGFSGALGLVDLDTPPELFEGALTGLRIYAGYAGWGAAQLEGEIAEGSWYVVPADPQDPFTDDAENTRRRVLLRQPAPLSWHVTRPADPTLN